MTSAAGILGAVELSPEATAEKRVGAVLFYGIVLLLLYFIYLIFAPFLGPLAWAAVLVVFFFPLHKRLEPTSDVAAILARHRSALCIIGLTDPQPRTDCTFLHAQL